MSNTSHLAWKNLVIDGWQFAVLATTGPDGLPHVRNVQELIVDDHGFLVYLEFFESSTTQKHLVHSLWFDRQVSFLIQSATHGTVQLRGIPREAIIAGPDFERYYQLASQKHPGSDLAAAWRIVISEQLDESWQHHTMVQANEHAIVGHLDHFARH